MSDYSDRGELVTTDSESLTVNETDYRIAVSVRYNRVYNIFVHLLRVKSTTPHDTIDRKRYRTTNRDDVGGKVNDGVEWATQRAQDQEDAKTLDVKISASVEDSDAE